MQGELGIRGHVPIPVHDICFEPVQPSLSPMQYYVHFRIQEAHPAIRRGAVGRLQTPDPRVYRVKITEVDPLHDGSVKIQGVADPTEFPSAP